MNFLTDADAKAWCRANAVPLVPPHGHPDKSLAEQGRQVSISHCRDRLFWLAQNLVGHLGPWSDALLWVTETEIWPSSENWHLYYRLRQANADHGTIADTPAHLFEQHESSELTSFLQLALTFGWDAHLLSKGGRMRAFISHDEWLRVWMPDAGDIDRFAAGLT